MKIKEKDIIRHVVNGLKSDLNVNYYEMFVALSIVSGFR